MKNTEAYLSEIKEIRQMMEQSSRFLSLSGLSGILIGIYALAGAFIAYRMIYFQLFVVSTFPVIYQLAGLATVVLILSLVTVLWLTYRRTKESGKKIWNPGSRAMCINLAVPLVSGGILILIFVSRGVFDIVAPSCLVFYGLALVNAAKFTRQEIFYMGLFQIVLGIFAALFPGMGLLFWATGFGVIHIIYGTVMYFRYEQNTK
ncbi:MAG: hypothetical protein A2W90_14970 [Bacteroidetes bacterium GWF2_42_66]|nr:MAG: hypothetical protein A2W92_11135 [Bacteroidetes bacterium GWA2_42_15]OFX98992.1 MAG: hypothetical protein A2W89_06555 [Bacteroidetes bacterium GWE2_42_39]OFY46061.1 MAG: hypothetical protein A2W90_14970 [Bacteroidetes bacterium GWF2_42_66]HBL77229.1 hypothetical protein [Prolixibacteraceae bacterium]HCR90076.1 hypothetical protein [Prolixibacteraceae bacterium]